jgi:hypothetical protein
VKGKALIFTVCPEILKEDFLVHNLPPCKKKGNLEYYYSLFGPVERTFFLSYIFGSRKKSFYNRNVLGKKERENQDLAFWKKKKIKLGTYTTW